MAKFRSNQVVDAFQFTGSNINEIWEEFGAAGIYGPTETNPNRMLIDIEPSDDSWSNMETVNVGDWVMRGNQPGTFVRMSNTFFTLKFDRVIEPPKLCTVDRSDDRRWCTDHDTIAIHRAADNSPVCLGYVVDHGCVCHKNYYKAVKKHGL